MSITIKTIFDITNTGVTRIQPEDAIKRRQQSNWETIVQVISLRSQPLDIETIKVGKIWQMTFNIEAEAVFRKGNDNLGLLKDDCSNVPMLTGLSEENVDDNHLIVDKNVWFEENECR